MLQQQTALGPFRKYVVIDVISNVGIDQEILDIYYNKTSNKEKLAQTSGEIAKSEDVPLYGEYHLLAPRNSVIAKLVGSGEGRIEDKEFVVMYPFFSSHISLPVKAGEMVWGLSETDGKTNSFYWVTRIHGPNHVEDANYTHLDRKGTPVIQESNEVFPSKEDYDPEEDKVEIMPSFPNGTAFENRASDTLGENPTEEDLIKSKIDIKKFTLPYLLSYENIVEDSFEMHVPEPVPRISKRPGDVVVQGSNNTAIILGTERGYSPSDNIDTEASNVEIQPEMGNQSGAIDIVVGRGRFSHRGSLDNSLGDPERTQPRIIENSRGEYETHKNVGLDSETAPEGSALHNVSEGDPDFVSDSARIYASMKSKPDEMFGLEYPETSSGAAVQPAEDESAIVIKADQIRIVSRKDETIIPAVNGAIRIIKEGAADTDRATIVMEADGTIMIDGPKIVIGSGFQDSGANSEGTQVVIGRDASESLVLGNTLGEQLCKLLGAIVTNQAAFSVGASPNVLSPAILKAATEVLTALGGAPSGEHTPTNNTTLSKVGKTK